MLQLQHWIGDRSALVAFEEFACLVSKISLQNMTVQAVNARSYFSTSAGAPDINIGRTGYIQIGVQVVAFMLQTHMMLQSCNT
jgi:hypothetical protein